MQNFFHGVQARIDRHLRALQMLLSLLTAATLALFSVQSGPLANLYYIETWEARRALIVLVFALLPPVMAYIIFVRGARGLNFFFLYGALTAALVLRTTTLSQIVGDYEITHAFVDQLALEGLGSAGAQAGSFGLIGTYLLDLIARLPIREIYLIKYFAIACDFALALSVCALVDRFVDRRRGTFALLAVLYNPLTWLTSVYWGKWDALCALLAVLSLYALLCRRRALCAALFALAYAAQAEALFLLPLLFLWPHHGLRARHLGAALCTLLVITLPLAMACGPLPALAAVAPSRLFAQSGAQLQNCAPTLYQFVPSANIAYTEEFSYLRYVPGVEAAERSKWYTQASIDRLFTAGVYAALIVLLGCAAACRRLRSAVSRDQLWQVLLIGALFTPMILPGMNARSFYLPALLSLFYALRYEGRMRVPVLVMGATFLGYVPALTAQYTAGLTVAMAMNVAALLQIARDFTAAIAPRVNDAPELVPKAQNRI